MSLFHNIRDEIKVRLFAWVILRFNSKSNPFWKPLRLRFGALLLETCPSHPPWPNCLRSIGPRSRRPRRQGRGTDRKCAAFSSRKRLQNLQKEISEKMGQKRFEIMNSQPDTELGSLGSSVHSIVIWEKASTLDVVPWVTRFRDFCYQVVWED